MPIAIRSISKFNPTGSVNSSKSARQVLLPRPEGLAVGDLYVIAVMFQSMYGTSSIVMPSGFALLSDRGTGDNRAMAVYARNVATQEDVDNLLQVQIVGSSPATRAVAIGMAITGANNVDPLGATGAWAVNTGTSDTVNFPGVIGSVRFGFGYSNSSAKTGQPSHNPIGGTKVVQATALGGTDAASAASTSLSIHQGASGFTLAPPAANSGGFLISLREAGDAGSVLDPGYENRLALAPAVNVPAITTTPMPASSAPSIPGSNGWMREKRVGLSESAAGASQTTTQELDIYGSTRFHYPGVVPGVTLGDPANAGQYIRTEYISGSTSQRWMFSVSFVLRGSNVVEFRHRAATNDPIFGRIYVNGQPISDQATQLSGITSGSGYAVKLTFPNDNARIITVYGLGGGIGSWGGVATSSSGSIKKPQAMPKRKVAFVGDAYVSGARTTPNGARSTETMIWRLAWLMGADEVVPAGLSGSGFNSLVDSVAETNFLGRMKKVLALQPDVIVFVGGRSDTPYDPQTSADTKKLLYEARGVKEAYMVPTASDSQISVRSAMLEAALKYERKYVNFKNASIELGTDKATPTFAGHSDMANKVFALMNAPTVVPPDVTEFYVVQSGQLHSVELVGAVSDKLIRTVEVEPYQPRPYVIDDLFKTNPFYIAHRGSGDNWPEHTFKSYSQSVYHGMKAIEVSVNRSSDGVFLCHHDKDTQRMCGEFLEIGGTPWAKLAQLTNSAMRTDNIFQERQPIPQLKTVLDAFNQQVIFIEDKSGKHAVDLLDYISKYPDSTNHFVWKQWAGAGQYAVARARGYKTWGFFSAPDIPNLATYGVNHDYLGADFKMSDAEIKSVVDFGLARNKPTISWEIHTPEDRARAMRLGVKGMMTSNIKAVLRSPLP